MIKCTRHIAKVYDGHIDRCCLHFIHDDSMSEMEEDFWKDIADRNFVLHMAGRVIILN